MMTDEERRAKVDAIMAFPLTDEIYGLDPLDGPVMLANIIVRQRSNEMHDPTCSRVQQSGGPCDCWLSRCVLTICNEPMAMTGVRRIQRYGFRQFTSEEEGGDWYDAPSIPVAGGCSRCERQQPICMKRHCMICGTVTQS